MNQKLKIFVIMFIICFCGFSQLYSQEQTAYQKKLIEIKRSFLKECLIASYGQENWSEKLETGLNNYSEKELNESLPMLKIGLAGLPKETAVKIVNKFIDDVANAKKIKSTDATKKEFDDAREKKINEFVSELKEMKKLLIEMGIEGY